MNRSPQSPPAIEVDSVSLSFRVRHERVTSFKEAILRRLRRRPLGDLFWALHDISFQVARGERLAVIGPNGSGKTSLLSLIAGIFPPDRGRVITRGRVVALLGLGTGFDPDMTGRVNIIFNAALYGLSERDIRDRLDDIIAFADIGDFIDAPVRTYSSGMVQRLGFAVAAHIDAEIMLLDEVLAVGDAEFVRKSKAHTMRLRDQGRTVILVSHDLKSVRELCERALWLEQGRIVQDGPVHDVVRAYQQQHAPLDLVESLEEPWDAGDQGGRAYPPAA